MRCTSFHSNTDFRYKDIAALLLFAAANLLPLLFWSRIDEWARDALVLYAGR